jgi:chromosome segregation ATPase
MHVAMREAWTDDRLDDLAKHMDEGFCEVKAEQRALRSEMKAEQRALRNEMTALRRELKVEMKELRTELKTEMGELKVELKGEMSELRTGLAQLNRRFDALLLTLSAGFLAAVLAQFVS